MKIRFATLLLACVLALTACHREATRGTGKGTVAGVDAAKGEVTLDHGDIPGIMGAMTMTFSVHDKRVLAGVKPGEKVEFDVEMRSGEPIVTAIRPR